MKIQVCSDLHLEINKIVDYSKVITPSAKILCLLGDIGDPTQDHYSNFLEWCNKNFERVFVISGNHEYYSNKNKLSLSDRDKLINEIVSKLGNVFFLNNNYYVLNDNYDLDDNYVILGTTLWSMVSKEEKQIIKNKRKEFRHIITTEEKVISVDEINLIHNNNCVWLKEKIERFRDKRIIVLTHHLPSYKLINRKFINSGYNSAFATNLEHLLKYDNVNYWFCGHSHTSEDEKIFNCQVMMNPCGYGSHNNKSYKKDLVIEIK